eukprot:11155267-Lingulodinium_polyedra.AAC.1
MTIFALLAWALRQIRGPGPLPNRKEDAQRPFITGCGALRQAVCTGTKASQELQGDTKETYIM